MAKRRTSNDNDNRGNIARVRGSSGRDRRKEPARSKSPVDPDVEQRMKIAKAMLRVAAALLLIITLVSFWRNRADWSCTNIVQCAKDAPAMTGGGDGFPVTVSGSRALDGDSLAGGVAVLSDTSFAIYNDSAFECDARAHFMSSPAMAVSGRYALVYDIGGKGYRLEAASGTINSGKTDFAISGGCVSRSGRFALTTNQSDRLSTLEIHERDGGVIHRWLSEYYYITASALSADGRYIALCGLNASGGRLMSAVIIQKVGSAEEVARFEYSDTELIDMEFTKSDCLIVIGSTKTLVISGYGDSVETIQYPGTVTAYDICYDTGIVLVTASSHAADTCTITAYDTRGSQRFSVNADIHGTLASMSPGGCVVLGRGHLLAYSLTGELRGSAEVNASCSGAVSVGYDAYLLESTEINKLNF